jgi:TRAP-type C4-dicarboxylate transport system substrate-binding protein
MGGFAHACLRNATACVASRRFLVAWLAAALLLMSCSGDPEAPDVTGPTSSASTVEPIEPAELTVATYDAADTPGGELLARFVEHVTERSGGAIVVEATFEVERTASPEQRVIEAVTAGDFDLGLTASRAFDLTGRTSLQALQAPFLITTDEAAAAVATSDAAADMLADLGGGVVGLTLWPEDLRHPFSVVKGETITSPADLDGLRVRVPPSAISRAVIEAMGGIPRYSGTYDAAESGWPNARFLNGVPTGTGNVVLYPKYQVLYANEDALAALSDAQRAVLRDAAADTQADAIAEHPGETETAAAWCEANGSIVLVDDAAVAAFADAARPVVDRIDAERVAAVEAIVAESGPAGGAEEVEACEAGATPAAFDPFADRSDERWSEGLPPDGVWRATQTVEQFLAAGVSRDSAEGWAAITTFTFDGGRGRFDFKGADGFAFTCRTTYEVVQDFVRLTYTKDPAAPSDDCVNTVEDWRWRLEGNKLIFDLLDSHDSPFVEDSVAYEVEPYRRVG